MTPPASSTKGGNNDGSADGIIDAILGYYKAYVQELTKLANGSDDPPAAKPAAQAPASQPQPPPAASSATAATTAATSTPQPSAPLQIGQVQASGPFKEAHLAGYPAVPDVPPVSSVPNPTAAQLQAKAATDTEQARIKRLLFEKYDNPQ